MPENCADCGKTMHHVYARGLCKADYARRLRNGGDFTDRPTIHRRNPHMLEDFDFILANEGGAKADTAAGVKDRTVADIAKRLGVTHHALARALTRRAATQRASVRARCESERSPGRNTA